MFRLNYGLLHRTWLLSEVYKYLQEISNRNNSKNSYTVKSQNKKKIITYCEGFRTTSGGWMNNNNKNNITAVFDVYMRIDETQ